MVNQFIRKVLALPDSLGSIFDRLSGDSSVVPGNLQDRLSGYQRVRVLTAAGRRLAIAEAGLTGEGAVKAALTEWVRKTKLLVDFIAYRSLARGLELPDLEIIPFQRFKKLHPKDRNGILGRFRRIQQMGLKPGTKVRVTLQADTHIVSTITSSGHVVIDGLSGNYNPTRSLKKVDDD